MKVETKESPTVKVKDLKPGEWFYLDHNTFAMRASFGVLPFKGTPFVDTRGFIGLIDEDDFVRTVPATLTIDAVVLR